MPQWLSPNRVKCTSIESYGWPKPLASATCLMLALMSWQAYGQVAVRVSPERFEPVFSDSRALPPGNPTQRLSTGGIEFNIWYQDVIQDSALGFDDPALGSIRRGTLDQVLSEVAATINMGGTLDILVEASKLYAESFLAAAGTLFPFENGFADSATLIRLRDGTKLFPNFEDIFMIVDFGFNWHTGPGPIQPDEIDLSSVLLHEITHGLGFLSLSSPTGESLAQPGVSLFTTYDSLIVTSDDTKLWGGAIPSLQVAPSVLTSNNVFFGGTSAISLYDQGGVKPGLFAPPTFLPGSSLSHWDLGRIVGGAVMEPSIFPGVIKNRYFLVDIGALIDIGYTQAAPAEFRDRIFLFVPGTELTRSGSEVTDGAREIDLTMSLYRDMLTDADNDLYVEILEHFADAVFEATEGRHRIRNVTGTLRGRFASVADIVWGRRGQPNSKIVGGRGIPGGHINMYDIFENGSGSSDLNFLANDTNRRKAGYVLAQQWMRFYLGIENEFAERSSDVPVVPSLMNDPYTAATTFGARLLNLSVRGDGQAPFTDFEHTAATAQHRLHGVSAWSTIARAYSDDPKSGHEVARGFRRSFDELQPVAPLGTNIPRIDLLRGLFGSPITYFDIPFDLPDPISIAFDDLLTADTRSSASLGAAQTQSGGPAVRTVLDTAPQTFQFPVNDTALELVVNVYFPISSAGVNIFLVDPLGIQRPVTSQDVISIFDVFGSLAPPVDVVSFVVTPPAPGQWSITLSSRLGQVETFFEAAMSTGRPPIVFSGSAIFGEEKTLLVPQSTIAVPATFLSYPEPFVVMANLSRGLGIKGANVMGTLTRPNGLQSEIELRDDGIAPDLIANDGSYSAEFSYFQNGTHLVRVSADNTSGKAALTYNGTSRSPSDGGFFMVPASEAQLPDERIDEDFLRTLDIVVVVEDMASDDHMDFFQAATTIAPNNADEFGRIDTLGDVDFFTFTAPMNPGGMVPLVVRASRLGNGFSAKLTVFDTDGRTAIGSGKTSPVRYLFSEVSLIPGFTYFASVEDQRATKFGGTYAFSVGPAIASDTEVAGIPSRGPSGGGGGGGGCLIATAAYGTPLAEEIEVLRVLRDSRLLRGAFGTAFVDTYYRLSPPVADAVASNEVLRTSVRLVLVPVLLAGEIALTLPIGAFMVLVLIAFAAWRLRPKAITRRT